MPRPASSIEPALPRTRFMNSALLDHIQQGGALRRVKLGPWRPACR